MKIAIDRLSEDKEVNLKEQVPVSLWDMNSSDLKFTDIFIDCSFVRVRGEIIVKADICTQREIVCSRCLDEVLQKDRYTFQRSYEVSSLKDNLDIDADIREYILLNFPMKVLCSPDCKGICSGCGLNLNHEECKCKTAKKYLNSGG